MKILDNISIYSYVFKEINIHRNPLIVLPEGKAPKLREISSVLICVINNYKL